MPKTCVEDEPILRTEGVTAGRPPRDAGRADARERAVVGRNRFHAQPRLSQQNADTMRAESRAPERAGGAAAIVFTPSRAFRRKSPTR
jgi:hypothetical protein